MLNLFVVKNYTALKRYSYPVTKNLLMITLSIDPTKEEVFGALNHKKNQGIAIKDKSTLKKQKNKSRKNE